MVFMVIAIEGPSNAGKSTLLSNIDDHLKIENYAILPCYVTFAGDEQQVPDAPAESVEEELRAQRFYRSLDKERMLSVESDNQNPDLIIMDRSVHTLLAHAYAISKIKDIPVYIASRQRALKDPNVTWPDAILYLDTPKNVLTARYKQSDENLGIFSSTSYNFHYRRYFLGDISNINATLKALGSPNDKDGLIERSTDLIHGWYT